MVRWCLVALQRSQGSWASQRALEAQVAQLTQQLDLAAATNVELQKEIEVSRAARHGICCRSEHLPADIIPCCSASSSAHHA